MTPPEHDQHNSRDQRDPTSGTGSAPIPTAAEVAHLRQVLAERNRLLESLEHGLAFCDQTVATLRSGLAGRDCTIATLQRANDERDAMLRSTSWRLTAPLRHLVTLLRSRSASTKSVAPIPRGEPDALTADAPVQTAASALTSYPEPGLQRRGRVTLLLHSLVCDGGPRRPPALAILFAAALAKRHALPLRVVTHAGALDPECLGMLLTANAIDYDRNIDFHEVRNRSGAGAISIAARETLVTAGCDETRIAQQLVSSGQILQVLGDQDIQARLSSRKDPAGEAVCGDEALRFLVCGLDIQTECARFGRLPMDRSLGFEPAYPRHLPDDAPAQPGTRRRLLLMLDPTQPPRSRALAIAALVQARTTGVLPATDWDFHLAPDDLALAASADGFRPGQHLDRQPGDYVPGGSLHLVIVWTANYRSAQAALAYCARGAVVITLQHPAHAQLPAACGNLFLSAADPTELRKRLTAAAALVADHPRHQANLAAATMNEDWEAAFAPLLDRLAPG